jgi:hypothetical protein
VSHCRGVPCDFRGPLRVLLVPEKVNSECCRNSFSCHDECIPDCDCGGSSQSDRRTAMPNIFKDGSHCPLQTHEMYLRVVISAYYNSSMKKCFGIRYCAFHCDGSSQPMAAELALCHSSKKSWQLARPSCLVDFDRAYKFYRSSLTLRILKS